MSLDSKVKTKQTPLKLGLSLKDKSENVVLLHSYLRKYGYIDSPIIDAYNLTRNGVVSPPPLLFVKTFWSFVDEFSPAGPFAGQRRNSLGRDDGDCFVRLFNFVSISVARGERHCRQI